MFATGPKPSICAVKRALILLTAAAALTAVGLCFGPEFNFSKDTILMEIALGLSLALYFLYRFIWAFLLHDEGRANGNIVGASLLYSIPALWICLRICLPEQINLSQFGGYVWATDFSLGMAWLATRYLIKLPGVQEVDG